MTYELHFENHPDPVEITAGFGFKAPKAWGKMVRSDVAEVFRPDLEINPLSELDVQIQVEEAKLAELVAAPEVTEIQKAIGRLDIRALIATGHDRRAMFASQRVLKTQELHEAEARAKTEIGNQQARVASLRRLRSEKRKDLSK